MDDPFRVFDKIKRAYLRYLDSPFRLRYDALLEERRSLLDQDRQLVRDDAGKIQYATVLEFDSREVADRFSTAALKAIEDFSFKTDFTPSESTS